MQPDPIGLAGGLNLYAYVNNDPLNARDPSGLVFQPQLDLCGSNPNRCTATGSRSGVLVPRTQIIDLLLDSSLGVVSGGGPGFLDFGGAIIPPAIPTAPDEPEEEGDMMGKEDENQSEKDQPEKPFVLCEGTGRILEGNPKTIGRPSGFSGSTVGDIRVTPNSAAIDVSQFGGDKSTLRPELKNISGETAGGQSFSSVTDVIGSTDVANVRTFLKGRFPDTVLLELISGKDEGVAAVTITLPRSLGCPDGTNEIER